MRYYHINPDTLEIIEGEFTLKSAYARKLLSTGNPELLPDLEIRGLVPIEFPAILPDRVLATVPVVTKNRVTFLTIPKPADVGMPVDPGPPDTPGPPTDPGKPK